MKQFNQYLFDYLTRKDGIALAMALYILIVFVILGCVMTGIMLSIHTSSRQDVSSLNAYYVAQSGLEYALNELKSVDDWASKDGDTATKSLHSAGAGSGNYPKFSITYDYPVVGAWEFNDFHTTSQAEDNSGNGNDGTIVGASYIDNSNGVKFGKALVFDGDNDYVNCGDINDLDTPGYLTVEIWFYRDTNVGSFTNHGINNVLVAKSSSGSNDNLEIGTQGSRVEIYIDSSNYDSSGAFNAGIQNDRWYFLVLRYNKDISNEVKVYVYDSIDDSLVTQQWSAWGGNLDSSGTSPFSIGIARPDSVKWGDFDGYIDSVRIYNRALGDDEIAEHYNTSQPVPFDIRRYLLIKSVGNVKYGGPSNLVASRKIELTVPVGD